MIASTSADTGLAARLREEFDRTFAVAADLRRTQSSHLLAIRIGGDPYALLVSEITGLHPDRTVVPVPASIPEFSGIAGIRGELVPVYSLAAMMGYERPEKKLRWLALCGAGQMLGLAFDDFERHLTLSGHQITAAEQSNHAEHVQAIAHADDVARPIINIPSIAAAIARRCATVALSKEK